ncbi:MAG: alanyl-tRNA editing protein [Lachnospiraceae bacterium]|nr:alanyl-tRNA editing protein [Lachnospiraceae bacterium]
MTEIYYEDLHQTEFSAIVENCIYDERKKLYGIVLDRTAFFPEQGGQTADKGTINGQNVADVHIKDGTIYHYVENAISIDTEVNGSVDFSHRFDFMQQHTAEHMLSGLVHSRFGYNNVGFHLSENETTVDFDGVLSLDELRSLEKEVNCCIRNALPVNILYPSDEELKNLPYRSKKELTGQIRIVEIPGIDICACCAPHCENTAQVGLFKIDSVMSHRGGVRVNILCGDRAIDDYTKRQDEAYGISVLLSAKQGELIEAVKLKQNELTDRQLRINSLQSRILELEIAALPSPEEKDNSVIFLEGLDTIAVRNAVNTLTERYPGYSSIFVGNDEAGYHFIIGSINKDCTALNALLRERLNAKGGGTPRMVQGSVAAQKSEILNLLP